MDRHLVSVLDSTSFEAEQYRQLRQRVEELRATRNVSVIAVTSAVAGDGKTLTAINLAGTLAQGHGRKVLLVDADLRHPTVAAKLGLDCTSAGFGAALQGGAGALQALVQPVEGSALQVLPSAGTFENTYELLSSSRVTELFAEARSNYEYIVVDTPPILAVQDTSLLRSTVDGFIVVVAAKSTPRKLVGEALNLLEPDSVVGLVFNRDKRPLFGYYKGYYRGYFRSYVREMNRQR